VEKTGLVNAGTSCALVAKCNCRNTACRNSADPPPARTRWGSLSAPPDPLDAIGGGVPTSKAREGNGKGEGREGRKGRGEEGRTPVPDWESAKVATLKSEVFIKYEAEISSRVSGGERVVDFGKLFTETNEQKFSLGGVQCRPKICSHPGRNLI